MPYFPHTFPQAEWWVGKCFVQQAVSIANSFLQRYNDHDAGFVLAEYRLLLNRGLRALIGAPIVGTDLTPLVNRLPGNLLKKIEFSRGLKVSTKGEFLNLTVEALVLTKDAFRQEFIRARWYEFDPSHNENWEGMDFVKDEFENADKTSEEFYERLSIMQELHDETFWPNSEVGIISGFGGYGEWRGVGVSLPVQMEVYSPSL